MTQAIVYLGKRSVCTWKKKKVFSTVCGSVLEILISFCV